jgi:hypothetical protein
VHATPSLLPHMSTSSPSPCRLIQPVEEILIVRPHWLRHLPKYLSFLPPEVNNLNWTVNLNGHHEYFSLLRNFLAMSRF